MCLLWAICTYFILDFTGGAVTFVSQYRFTGFLHMDKTPSRPSEHRMIHIRLDEDTHRRLKMHAAESRSSIQRLVESLIRRKYTNRQSKEVEA